MRTSMTRRIDRTVNPIATVGLLGLSTALGAEAQAGLLPPMVGMTVNSYSMTANTPSRAGATATSLTIANSTANLSFNPSFILGEATGDSANGGNWKLQANGADYGPLLSSPNAVNLVGGSCRTADSSTPNFSSSDTLSLSMVLVFSGSLDFSGLNIGPDGGNSTIASATLAQSGGSTADLLTTSSGTSFAAGTYTLTMSVTANGGTDSFAAYAAFTTAYAVPGSGLAAIAGGLLTSLGGGRRRR